MKNAAHYWVDARSGNRLRGDLARELSENLAFAHGWLVHSDGGECPPGCDMAADPKRLALYRALPE
jgi:hypothetical protein